MSRLRLPFIVLATLVTAGCGTGGRDYWVYPAPHLGEGEEARLQIQESDQVRFIDGVETESKCWGDRLSQQGYHSKDRLCRLHLRPGQHTVLFRPQENAPDLAELSFTAFPGKAYSLDRSGCPASFNAHLEQCRVTVVEIESPVSGG